MRSVFMTRWKRMWIFTDPNKRRIGINLVYRSGDWWYLDINLWWKDFMINLWRAK